MPLPLLPSFRRAAGTGGPLAAGHRTGGPLAAGHRTGGHRATGALAAAAIAISVVGTGGGGSTAAADRRVIDGPDVASYQHPNGAPIDWHRVARAGHEFAIVKATEGTFYRNPWFRADYSRSRRAGLVRGSYHFARPAYPVARTARKQARYYVARLDGSATTNRTLPPALDLETTGGLGRGALVTWAQEFLLKTRKLTGRIPMIYTYPTFWTGAMGDPAALARYPLWMASYHAPVDPSATLWQYTAGASVRGIRGSVDMSRLVASPESWSTLADGRSPNPWPASTPGAPQSVHTASGDGVVTVSWLPGDSGSVPIRRYRVTMTPGDRTKVVDSLDFGVRFGGLDNGAEYSFTVTGVNGRGAGSASEPVTEVPLVPVTMTVPDPTTEYGDDARVRVRLTRTDTGRPLDGREVRLERRDEVTGEWTVVRTLVTGGHGWDALTFDRPEHSIDLRLTFVAPDGWQQVQRDVSVLVTNDVSAHLSRSRVHSGHPVTISGRIDPAVGGVTVRRQAFYRHRWHVLQKMRTADDGSYSFTFTPHSKVRSTKVLRVVVRAFDGRARGLSPSRRLLVRP